jgi:hypothetical protein
MRSSVWADREEAIEKVLAGLRDVDVPDGMERRILQALEERELARAGARSLAPTWLRASESRVLVSSVGLVGLLVLALVIPVVRRPGRVAVQAEASRAAAAPLVNRAGSERVVESTHLSSAGSHVRGIEEGNSQEPKTMMQEAKTVAVLDSDALAVEEMRATSRPAPPLPLTEQERLLLLLAHSGGGRQELAKLDPLLRGDREAEDAAEFQRFFFPVDEAIGPDDNNSESTVENEGDGR